ncbi:fimbrial biogenesis chaperone [Aeromonas jandaei]|uniref:fimbrial biogenesis chaperone n=1 Tax=Aeromonas jandaei TaxID=650 RepID=UPI002AA0C6E5|nr:molecular chaperone [Aeromonas jandaei]
MKLKSQIAFILLLFCINNNSYASIKLSATRLIFSDGEKEQSVTVSNNGNARLAQSWLDKNHPADPVPPFAVTPPLAKLTEKGSQLLRVHYAGQGLPDDRESMYWLAVQEIPQKAEGQNVIQFAVQQRIKVFYRPVGLPGKASDAPLTMKMALVDGKLTVSNPTPYFINLATLEAGNESLGGEAIAPFGQLVLPAAKLGSNAKLDLTIVNDFGAHVAWQAQLHQGLATGAVLVNR